MTLLTERLAQAAAAPRHPCALPLQPIVCRQCGCDDNHACIDEHGRACAWLLLDVAYPSGVCSACAAEIGFERFFFFCEALEQSEAA